MIASLLVLMASCNAYKRSLLFQIDEEQFTAVEAQAQAAVSTYQIKPYDELEVAVYTNKGERLVDPNNALGPDAAVTLEPPVYTISHQGKVALPLLGEVELVGLTLEETNLKLAELYQSYYKDPFVITRYANKRAVVLGASTNKIVPLKEGMNLLEVIALAGDLTDSGKSSNIRLLRGDFKNPDVYVIDLSTIEGLRKANLVVEPNDIIYIEPARRPLAGLRDFTPIISAITSILALIVALNR